MDGTLEESSSTADWFPADLSVSAVLAVTIGGFVLVTDPGPSRTALWMAFVSFVPGYVLVCAAFPREYDGNERTRIPGPRTHIERALLSVAVSIGLHGVVAMVLWTLGSPERSLLVVSLSTITVIATGVAALRRESVSPHDRFDPDLLGRLSSIRTRVFGFETPKQLSQVVLTIVIVLAAVGAAYAVVAPDDQPGETTLYLLTDDDTAATSDYPDTLEAGQEESMIVGIENQEGESITYTVVVQLQVIETIDSEPTVESATELDRFEVEVGDGETIERERTFTANRSGEELRLEFLLYPTEPPTSPDQDSAYRSAYVWVDVEE